MDRDIEEPDPSINDKNLNYEIETQTHGWSLEIGVTLSMIRISIMRLKQTPNPPHAHLQ